MDIEDHTNGNAHKPDNLSTDLMALIAQRRSGEGLLNLSPPPVEEPEQSSLGRAIDQWEHDIRQKQDDFERQLNDTRHHTATANRGIVQLSDQRMNDLASAAHRFEQVEARFDERVRMLNENLQHLNDNVALALLVREELNERDAELGKSIRLVKRIAVVLVVAVVALAAVNLAPWIASALRAF